MRLLLLDHLFAESPEALSLIHSFVKTAEDLTTPYRWQVYDILFLPESFPYGGKLASPIAHSS